LQTPPTGWILCTEGERAFDYRLLLGKWDLDSGAES
jgi:hypothetical protein